MGVAGALMGFDKLPYWLDAAVKMVGDTGSGIALIALGASIRFENFGEAVISTWRDCLFKLFISPALILASSWPGPSTRCSATPSSWFRPCRPPSTASS